MKKIDKFSKLLSLILSITIIFGLTPSKVTIADDDVQGVIEHEHNNSCNHEEDSIEIYADDEIKPKIDINYLGTTPTSPMEGQDFKVRYQIVPHPFQHNLSKTKELVMVLDKSGSMKYCSTHGKDVGHKIEEYIYKDSTIICYNDDFGWLGGGKCSKHNKYKSSHTQKSCNETSKIAALKVAANNFVSKLTELDKNTNAPKITNLSIGIVAYDDNGNIIKDLITVTNDSEVIQNNVSKLLEAINNINASGGTNTGDGLRKGTYILDKSKSDANKAIVFMGDGEPTYYSNKTNNDIKNYYTNLDEKVVSTSAIPYRRGSGNSDNNGYSLGYATTIGNIIKDKQYNVFSIGYGLGEEDSAANKKMKQIHESMGGINSGEKSTFFATDAGAIDSVFSKIADTLEKSYSFSDAQLDLNLSENIQAVDGFSTIDGNGNIIKINPIVYQLGEGNWYTAETQTIEFTIRANNSGEFNIFKDESNLVYTDIYGNTQKVPVENSIIVIEPFEAAEAQKLSVDLKGDLPGYLIGDTITTTVIMIHPKISGITYSEANFNFNDIPSNFKMLNGNDLNFNFGNVNETISKECKFTIEDDSEVTTTKEKTYTLSGDYSYKLKQNNATTSISGDKSLDINVKRGQINIKVLDEKGNDITELSTVVIKDKIANEVVGNFNSGNIVFDNVSSGNHELVIKNLPEGCSIAEDGSNVNLAVNYTNNVVNYTFRVKGTAVSSKLEIDANLIGYSPTYPYVGDDITITYEIDPKEFIKENIGSIELENAKLVFDLGSNFTIVEGGGLVSDGNGKYILDFADKLSYEYDSENNKYIANKFNVSFTIKANSFGENITFNSSKIQYTNTLSDNNEVIEKDIESPSIIVRENIITPEYNGPDIRILEIEPADSFKLTNSTGKITTGNESFARSVDGTEYIVEITHITMGEFIGKVDDLNGKYDVVVIGRYVDNELKNPNGNISAENTAQGSMWFRDYVDLENDITNKKATEIKEFINSGQLVFIDSDIKSLNGSKLWWHTTNSDGEFNQTIDNLIKNMSVNSNDSNKITVDSVIEKYLARINENKFLIKPQIISSSPEGDSHNDELGEVYKRNMRFNIKSKEILDEDITINLYLDINGDGLFREEEVVKTVNNIKISEEGYRLDYNLYPDYPQFIGYLEWRIELVKSNAAGYTNSIKSYFDGNILFRRVTEEKRLINVLQISPFDRRDLEATSSSNKGGNLNLKTNTAFQKLLLEKEVQDYEVNIEVISYQDFYQGNNLGPGTTSLNGSKYHMIIMGFADTFKDKTISNKGIEEIKKFIDSGQGLMLTHDTLWYKSWDGWQKNIRNAPEFIKVFRDIIGQSRYIDPNNESEKGLNNEKITHDPNRPSGDYAKEAGATLLELNGVNNSNSTEVYRVNESLITNYPFELGESIRVRRTHGQYLQLNFEEDDVVPLFNLTENNANNVGNNDSIDWNHQTNQVNRYDSRNSYYTYSKGNITFSGTGENSRESVEYPDSELRLFVNTIVKAERGANHKPEISALENISEVPYNSGLEFNAIVKDIDGDKIRINKITVDGSAIEGYKSKTEFFEQGSKFPVTITRNYLENKLGKDVKVVIEAEDAKGAISVKEYTIIPVRDALLTSSGETVNTLVGEKVNFDIKLNRENDTTPSSIIVKSVDIPSKDGIVTLSEVNTKVINGEIYLSGTLAAIVEVTGEEIPITINYINGTSNIKKCEVKIILNSKYASVNVVVKGDNGNIGISPKVTLFNKTSSKSYISNISSVDGQVEFNTIDSGEYEMSLTELVGYNVESIKINGNKVNSSSDGKIGFNINFNESSKIVEILVKPQISDIYHGLYGGIGETSENNSTVKILENANGFEMVAGTKVTFGAKFTVGGNSFKFNLDVDSKLEDVLLNNIKVYKTVNNNGDITLEELTNINGNTVRTTEVSGKSFEVSISNIGSTGSTKENEIVVIYTGTIKNNSKNDKFTNVIKFTDNKTKDAIIYTTNNGQDEIKELPDLF